MQWLGTSAMTAIVLTQPYICCAYHGSLVESQSSFRCTVLTQISQSANIPIDLLAGVLRPDCTLVFIMIYSCTRGLTLHRHLRKSTIRSKGRFPGCFRAVRGVFIAPLGMLTGSVGRRESTDVGSRSTWGSRNSLNLSVGYHEILG